MEALPATLDDTVDALTRALADPHSTCALDDTELITALATAGRMLRLAEAAVTELTAEVIERSDPRPHADRVTTLAGAGSVAELVERATRVSRSTALNTVTAARAVHRQVAPSTGETLPCDLPAMRDAMRAGHVGIDGMVGVARAVRRLGTTETLAADAELAASARGEGADGEPPASADRLREFAAVWAAYFDPDGEQPDDARGERERGLTFGRLRNGGHRVRGSILPDVMAVLDRELDALLGPHGGGVSFTDTTDASADTRTRAQKTHDAFAIIVQTAAASGGLPKIGGAAPTLVVTAREDDLTASRGRAYIDDASVALSVATHAACVGFTQRVVFDAEGRIARIELPQRLFTVHQRRAIMARDGGCAIPGCPVPAHRCEVHHIVPHHLGGPTHVENGVLLCWWHHRSIDTGGWHIRTRDGRPEIRGPYWWDPERRWRPTSKSPTRLPDRMIRRT